MFFNATSFLYVVPKCILLAACFIKHATSQLIQPGHKYQGTYWTFQEVKWCQNQRGVSTAQKRPSLNSNLGERKIFNNLYEHTWCKYHSVWFCQTTSNLSADKQYLFSCLSPAREEWTQNPAGQWTRTHSGKGNLQVTQDSVASLNVSLLLHW